MHKGAFRRQVEREFTPANPAQVVHWAPEFLKPGMQVVLLIRVSTENQKVAIPDHIIECKRDIGEFGASVVDEVVEWASGKDTWTMRRAVQCAKANGVSTVVARDITRILRGHRYIANTKDRSPLVQAYSTTEWMVPDMEAFLDAAEGFDFVTLQHPADYSNSEATRLGQRASGNKGGRGKKRDGNMSHSELRQVVQATLNSLPLMD